MPTVLRIGPYRFYFYSHEPNEPPHIHVDRDDLSAKIREDVMYRQTITCTIACEMGGHSTHGMAQIGGRRACHGSSASSCEATRISKSSRPNAAASCTPMGSPSRLKASGSEIE